MKPNEVEIAKGLPDLSKKRNEINFQLIKNFLSRELEYVALTQPRHSRNRKIMFGSLDTRNMCVHKEGAIRKTWSRNENS